MSASTVMGLSFFPQQWRAVCAPPGPVLVLAGPGAGKTRCLTGRIGYLLESGTDPRRVCAITFTNKAAQEIRQRLHHGLGDRAGDLTLGTIHALCLRLLRDFGKRVGLPAGFGVADEEQQGLLLGRLGVPGRRHRPLLTLFGRRRLDNHALSPGDEKLFGRYTRELRSHHLIDFDEILFLTRALFESSGAVLADCRGRWDHVLVDEFQDLDFTQYAILKYLTEGHRSVFVVGDDEQSIFSWRGADPRVLARFAADFDVREPIVLDVNCRCARTIFAAARRVLPPAAPLFAKQITAVRESAFDLRAVACDDEAAEADWIVADLRRDQSASGLRRGELAILYRNNAMGQRFEEALIAAGTPCQLGKGQSLAEDPVIAPLLAALRVVARPDSDLCVEQLARKLLPEVLLLEAARRPGATWRERLRALAEQPDGTDPAPCWRFLYQLENLQGLRRLHHALRDLVHGILEQGVGRLESALDPRHDLLHDPEELPASQALAAALTACKGRVLVPLASGLEIPVKVMLRRALPGRAAEYLAPGAQPGADDVVIPLHPGAGTLAFDPSRLRIIQVFKALQVLEGARFHKGFPDYVVFDTETTGTDVARDEVIELAAVRVRGGRVADTFRALVRSRRPIGAGAAAVHGYTDADLCGQPELAEVWPRFRAFAGRDVLVVHNGHRFDVPLLRRLTADCGGLDGLSFLDTLPLARSLFPVGGLRLEDLAGRFGVPRGRGHHALDDSLCLAGVFERLQEERLRRSRKTCRADLLDCVFLGAMLEGGRPQDLEDAALVEAARWRDLRRPPAVVDAYLDEAQRFGLVCPPLDELIERMGGQDDWPGARGSTVRDRYPESCERLERLLGLVKTTTLDEALPELLDRAALSISDGAGVDPDRVALLTFHSTKGLEFSRVYVAGVEDDLLPGTAALAEGRSGEIAEARRLLYVAMTRAKDRLTLTCCRERNGRSAGGTRFLDEMGLTTVEDAAGVCP
jgi:superfamily I DNA/RNA helicase/DNA polymerase III epsilon subunit-like protein